MSAGQAFCLNSLGDRIRGRWTTARQGRAVVLGPPDGCASHPWVDSRFAAWCDFATLVALDLPLCGSRTCEKLSEHGLDPTHPLSARIRGDLEIQLAADLCAIRAMIGAAGPLAFVGCGPLGGWFRAACERAGSFSPVLTTAQPDDAWHAEAERQIKKL